MIALKIDNDGDFVYENGSFVMVQGDEQLAQEVRIAIQTNKGEWFMDYDEGMDRNYLLGKNYNENRARSSIIETLMNISEPLVAESIVFRKVQRILLIDLTLRKQDGGTLTVEGVRI